MERSFIDQLQEVLGGEKVEELWILSPFYDPKARALEQLIEMFKPKVTNILVQPRHVSANPAAIRRLSNKLGKKLVFFPFETVAGGQSAYVHAKLYLFKTADRAVCLQGSPNCSQVAMLTPAFTGNLEMANLCIGKRNAFDHLLEYLDLQPATESSKLRISYREIETAQEWNATEWLLTGAAWRADMMTLYFRNHTPELGQAQLHIEGTSFKVVAVHTEQDAVHVRLTPEAQALLSEHAVPIILETQGISSYPVFPCHLDMLDREANTIHSSVSTQDLQNFDPGDPEFINLLRELEASFPLDNKSIWQLAGKATYNQTSDEDDEEYHLDYGDIDFELIRQHPKIQQYLQGRGSAVTGSNLSRLRQLLNAINSHFSGLADVAFQRKGGRKSLLLAGSSTAENMEDETAPAEPPESKPPINRNKVKNILKRFIRRYLKGLRSREFLRVVGMEVVVNNYVIFSHVLWRLLKKDEWIDVDFVLESFGSMLSFFWGNGQKTGFITNLSKTQQTWVVEVIRRQKSDALALAVLHYANWQCMLTGDIIFRLRLRELWRHMLSASPFEFEKEIVLDTWVYLHDVFLLNIPSPGRIVTELGELARLTNTSDSLDALEKRLGLQQNSFLIKKAGFFRELHGRTEQIEYLESSVSIPTFEEAKDILRAWMQIGKRSYHSVKFPRGLIYFDADVRRGLYYNQETGEEIPIQDLAVDGASDWEKALTKLGYVAQIAEIDITLTVTSLTPANSSNTDGGRLSRIQ